MNQQSIHPLNLEFSLTDPQGLQFDDHPELFVLLDRAPVVFTVKGLAYFTPRFKRIGLNIADIRTAEDFHRCNNAWLDVEWRLLQEMIAHDPGASDERKLLNAVLTLDIDEAESLVSRMEHRRRAGLRLV